MYGVKQCASIFSCRLDFQRHRFHVCVSKCARELLQRPEPILFRYFPPSLSPFLLWWPAKMTTENSQSPGPVWLRSVCISTSLSEPPAMRYFFVLLFLNMVGEEDDHLTYRKGNGGGFSWGELICTFKQKTNKEKANVKQGSKMLHRFIIVIRYGDEGIPIKFASYEWQEVRTTTCLGERRNRRNQHSKPSYIPS